MEDSPVEEDLSPELIPCRVCSRTFQSTSLKKHEKVCEKNAIKKRKPFDSLKQRVEGTDIAPFHQRSYIKKPEPTTPEVVKKKRQSWKEKHLELLNSIRAAKGVPSTETMPTSKSTSSFSADTERCPSCDRHFGPKAYDRHVEWCKEKKAHERLHQSPANVLLAKERLEARTKYVPPLNKAKKTPVREKYSPSFTGKAESTTSLVSQPSIRRKRIDNNNMAKSREKAAAEEKKEIAKKKSVKNLADERPKLHESKSMEDRRKDNAPSARSTSPRADSIKRNSTPDPYTLAQLQFMELLECNDFKSLTTTPTPLKNTKVTDHQNNKTSEKTSKKPSKKLFKDSLESLTDDFELMESLIDENFKNGNDNVSSNRSSLHNKIPGDDNFPIDPSLINENDNLSLPEHFVLDEDSPESVIDTNFLVTTKQTERTEKKSTSSSTTRPNTTKPKLTVNKATPNKKKPSESLITKPKSSTSQKSATDKNLGKTPKKTVSSSIKSVSSSFSSERILRSEEGRFKKNSPEPIPTISTSIKNRKNTRTSPEHEENVGDWFNNDLNRSPDDSLKPEDLFAVDDDMYEEFKKYEEMYLKEKKQNKPRKNKPKLIEINYKILTEENQGHVKNQVAGDSAYGSLTRNTPDHHVKLPTLPLMDSNLMDSVIVDEEDCTSPDLPKKISKFCHECGNRYPLASAKFCVECGVRRLIL